MGGFPVWPVISSLTHADPCPEHRGLGPVEQHYIPRNRLYRLPRPRVREGDDGVGLLHRLANDQKVTAPAMQAWVAIP